ncbi:zinc dependent phospholipase C family protein [Hymenobacter sp. IS2118]|uniref:zinc dependent phospholipase C family protein n=1 Tax=Hymenobacter sp. IS2118 TaxID=1505605 RepID=UPI0006896E36|nr:zinc dependent phospholipase C family protein [Hymenobacter sp. IS2118]
MKKTLLPLLLAALVLASGTAGAWGFFGHRTITQVAVYELPASMQAFYYRHMTELVRQSTAPDERRNDDPTEAPKHFIDVDHFSEDNPFGKMPRQYEKAVAKFTADTLQKYGTVPWVIIETKNKLTEAFRQRDTVGIVTYSAELSHYMGDAYVPLHTTINYDGQLTDQKGLHSLWESQLPERFINDYKLFGDEAKYIKDPLAAVWTVVQESFGFVGETFDRASKIEKTMKPDVRFTFSHRYGKTTRRYSDAFADEYEKAVGGMVSYRMKMAPTMISSLWLTAWQDAGKPNLNELMHLGRPTKVEKEKLTVELAAWKANTLSQNQLLLAQQKVKKIEVADEIKPAKDMGAAPKEVKEDEPAEPAPEAEPAPAPVVDKMKVKTKSAKGTEKTKQKASDW